MEAPRVGLVLGAGGVTGMAFHAGVLTALHAEVGWDPRTADIIVGTSAGSTVGAFMRAGLEPKEVFAMQRQRATDPEAVKRMRGAVRPRRAGASAWLSPSAPTTALKQLRRPWKASFGAIGASMMPEGTAPTEPMGERVRGLLGTSWPTQTYWACAVHLESGNRVVFGNHSGIDVGTAVEASSAIPGVFKPVEIDGDRHVDGAVHSPTNADLLVDNDIDIAVVLSPMSSTVRNARPRADSAMRVWSRARLDNELKALDKNGIKTLVIEPDKSVLDAMGINAMDPRRVTGVLDSAKACTEGALLDYSTAGVSVVDRLRMA